MSPARGSGEMTIPFFSSRNPTLASDNYCLITTQEITKSED